MQNTIVKEFEGNPDVVTAVFEEGGKRGETYEWASTFWSNYYLRGSVIWDEDGSAAVNYRHPATGLPFARGFIIDRAGRVALPYFGHNPKLAVETIRGLIAFVRGDANGDRELDISDAVGILLHLFAGQSVSSLGATDANADGSRDLSDAIYLLNYLFVAGPPPPAPFPESGF